MMIEMKYVKKELFLFLAMGWGVVALMGLGLLAMFTLTPMSMGLFILLPLVQVILSISLCLMYISAYGGSRNYLVLDEDFIYKDSGLVRSKGKMKRSEIEDSLLLGSTLRLVDVNGKEFSINLDCVKIKDIEILKENLSVSEI